MKERIEKWWDSFVSLKWWVQAIIIVIVTIGIHNYILHQENIMPGHYGGGMTAKQKKKLPKGLQKAIMKKKKKKKKKR